MKLWFDWAFDSNGDATNDLKAMFLPPPGTIMAYYLKAPEATVKSTIAMLGRAAGDTGDPFWVLCDGDSTYGSNPDLRGRVIVGGGAGTGLTNRSVDGSVFGSETVTLSQDEIPLRQHYHGFGAKGDNNDAKLITRSWSGNSQTFNLVIGDGEGVVTGSISSGDHSTTNAIESSETSSESVSGHSNVQPSMAVWYMMRTPRIA